MKREGVERNVVSVGEEMESGVLSALTRTCVCVEEVKKVLAQKHAQAETGN